MATLTAALLVTLVYRTAVSQITTPTTLLTTTTPIAPTWFPDCGVANGTDYAYLQTLQKWYKANEGGNLCVDQFTKLSNTSQTQGALMFVCADYMFNLSIVLPGYNATAYQTHCARTVANTYDGISYPHTMTAAVQLLGNAIAKAKLAREICYGSNDLLAYADSLVNVAEKLHVDIFAQIANQTRTVLTYGVLGINPDNTNVNKQFTTLIQSGFTQVVAEFDLIRYNMVNFAKLFANEFQFQYYTELSKDVDAVQAAFELFVDSYTAKDPQPLSKFERVCEQRNLHVYVKMISALFEKYWPIDNVNFTPLERQTFPYFMFSLVNYNRRQYVYLGNSIRQDFCRAAYLLNICNLALNDSVEMVQTDNQVINLTYHLLMAQLKAAENKIVNEVAQHIQPQISGLVQQYANGRFSSTRSQYISNQLRKIYPWLAISVLDIDLSSAPSASLPSVSTSGSCVAGYANGRVTIFVYVHNQVTNNGADKMMLELVNNTHPLDNGCVSGDFTAASVRDRHNLPTGWQPSLVATVVGSFNEATSVTSAGSLLYHRNVNCRDVTNIFWYADAAQAFYYPYCNLLPIAQPYEVPTVAATTSTTNITTTTTNSTNATTTTVP